MLLFLQELITYPKFMLLLFSFLHDLLISKRFLFLGGEAIYALYVANCKTDYLKLFLLDEWC